MDFFNEIWMTLMRNKSRSLLTAFGVFWGVFMLVVLMGLGQGIRRGILAGTENMATNSAFIFNNPTSMPYMGFKKDRQWSMTEDDIDALRSHIPQIKFFAPVIWGAYQQQGNVVRGSKIGAYRVMGFTNDYTRVMPLKVLEGRFVNDFDERDTRKVCVIGVRVKNDLFLPSESPIGKLLRVNGIYYRVVGVVEQYTDNVYFFGSTEEMVILPFSTVQQANNMGRKLHSLCISVGDDDDIAAISDKAEAIIRQRNMIHPDDDMAVGSFNLQEIFAMFNAMFMGLTTLILIVGIGTLLAGVVGVSNIMLITVRERTVEIGIRRALGATPAIILRQVMTESLALTFIAGMMGVVVAVLLLGTAEVVLASADVMIKSVQIDLVTAIAAVIIISIAGVFAGYLPARRALSIKAIEALQEE